MSLEKQNRGKKRSLLAFILVPNLMLLGTSCSKKNDYPPEATQTFMNSCQQQPGANVQACSCLLDKIQQRYNFEEYSVIDTKLRMNQPVDGFYEFMGKARAQCIAK